MNREVIFIAKEYDELKYKDLLQSYLLEYEDYEEIDFIDNEIKRYSGYVIILEELEQNRDFWSDAVYDIHLVSFESKLYPYSNNELSKPLHWKDIDRSILSFTKIIKFLELQKENVKPTHIKADAIKDVYLGQPTNNKDYKDTIWFKTGIPLATGEAFDLYRKYKDDKGYFESICLELGFKKSDRPYFSETINDNPKATDTNKNTFANKGKLQKLHKHLAENQLPFGDEFLKKYNALELE
jgi:hypothetical protein